MTMGRKLTIPCYRPKFIEKTAGEVGSGKEYPLLATLDQIAELFCRVRQSEYTAGRIVMDWMSGMTAVERCWVAPTVTPNISDPFVSYGGQLKRGYQTRVSDSGVSLSPYAENFLGEEYTVAGDGYRDIANNELGMWLPGDVTNLPQWNMDGKAEVTAFSYYGDNNYPGTGYLSNHLFYAEENASLLDGCFAQAVFNGEVAVILADPENDLLDPANEFYIGFKFDGYDYSFLPGGFSTLESDVSPSTTSCNYIVRLVSGDLTTPIYISTYGFPSASGSGIDVVHAAIEWWPYNTEADGSGDPVWDTATGAKL